MTRIAPRTYDSLFTIGHRKRANIFLLYLENNNSTTTNLPVTQSCRIKPWLTRTHAHTQLSRYRYRMRTDDTSSPSHPSSISSVFRSHSTYPDQCYTHRTILYVISFWFISLVSHRVIMFIYMSFSIFHISYSRSSFTYASLSPLSSSFFPSTSHFFFVLSILFYFVAYSNNVISQMWLVFFLKNYVSPVISVRLHIISSHFLNSLCLNSNRVLYLGFKLYVCHVQFIIRHYLH